MWRRRDKSELEVLNQIARDSRITTPPSSGITSSAEELGFVIDNIAMQTINLCAERATKYHVQTRDMIAAVVARIQGTPTK